MASDLKTRCFVDQLTAEHRRLNGLLQRAQSLIVHSIDPDEQASFQSITTILTRLRADLERHFDQEECSGCLEEAACRCPHLADQAACLKAEHDQLLGQIAGMIDGLSSLSPTPQNQVALQHRFDQLFKKLLLHEQAESALLAAAFGINQTGDEPPGPVLTFDT